MHLLLETWIFMQVRKRQKPREGADQKKSKRSKTTASSPADLKPAGKRVSPLALPFVENAERSSKSLDFHSTRTCVSFGRDRALDVCRSRHLERTALLGDLCDGVQNLKKGFIKNLEECNGTK